MFFLRGAVTTKDFLTGHADPLYETPCSNILITSTRKRAFNANKFLLATIREATRDADLWNNRECQDVWSTHGSFAEKPKKWKKDRHDETLLGNTIMIPTGTLVTDLFWTCCVQLSNS